MRLIVIHSLAKYAVKSHWPSKCSLKWVCHWHRYKCTASASHLSIHQMPSSVVMPVSLVADQFYSLHKVVPKTGLQVYQPLSTHSTGPHVLWLDSSWWYALQQRTLLEGWVGQGCLAASLLVLEGLLGMPLGHSHFLMSLLLQKSKSLVTIRLISIESPLSL